GAARLSVSMALGHPRDAGPPGAPQRPEVPYEDATSTERRLLLSNGSPPSQGLNHHGGTQPSRSRRPALARGVARVVPRERTHRSFTGGERRVNPEAPSAAGVAT